MAADEVSEEASLFPRDPSLQDTAIAILSADHAVLSCNDGVLKLTGYTLQAFSHLDLADIFQPTATMDGLLHKVMTGEPAAGVRAQLRTADGRHLPVEVHAEFVHSCDSSTARIILLFYEVSSEQVRGRREAGHPLWGQLAGDLSHEIRNPMNAIYLHMDIVEDEVREAALGDATQVVQSLATMKAELTRLHGLIQDYLFLARLSDIQRTRTELHPLLEDLIDEVRPQCAVQEVAVILNGFDGLAAVALHQSSFRRALLNILQLLIEGVPPHTTLSLSGRRTSAHVQLQIHDLNHLIPSEVWVALQKSLRVKTPAPVDLRAYVAQAIITAHGGRIAVCDDAKAGTLCTIMLPLDGME